MDKIDFVITWVDGNDIEWQKRKSLAKGISSADNRESRYRDWETLKYWFRSVEKYAPWVNKVYFVSCGHYPDWLNMNCDKLVFIKHEDFIPMEYLPTFSCRPIEFNLHRIPGLEEHFVYFNDDMFITRNVSPKDFFLKGLPRDSAILDAISITAKGKNGESLKMEEIYSSLFYNISIINRHFDKRDAIKDNLFKWFNFKYGINNLRTLVLLPWNIFTGIKSDHLPYSYLKKTFNDLWDAEYEVLDRACSHRFREPVDVSSRLVSFWQIVKGDFYPRSPHVGLQTFLSNDNEHNRYVFDLFRNRKYKLLCVNDEYSGDFFDDIKAEWLDVLDGVFPDKSSFEI